MQLFSGLEALKIDISSSYGLDKETWQTRLDWFAANENNLMGMMASAKEPALYFAGVNAYQDTLKGIPSGYPVSLDACASGLSLMAILTGDRKAAALCNVVDTGGRVDAYTAIYDAMLTKVGETSKISRDMVKGAVMTSAYGSKAEPKKVFGKGKLLDIFYETMQEMAPGPWELMQVFLDIWDPTVLEHNWVMPDNFHVKIKVESTQKETVHFLNEPFDVFRTVNAPVEKGRSLSANAIHSTDGLIVREMTRRCNYDADWVNLLKDMLNNEGDHYIKKGKMEAIRMTGILWKHYEETRYLSARILNYLDSDTIGMVNSLVIERLIGSLPAKPFQIMTIHDNFRCLSNYANDMRMQYNRQLWEIGRSNLLSSLLSQITGRHIPVTKLDPTLVNDILQADYALS